LKLLPSQPPRNVKYAVVLWLSSKKFLIFREERLRFWSDPETEIKLAKDTGVTVFRMGIDWTRIMPVEPVNSLNESVS